MSDPALEAQLAAESLAISQKQTTNYANIEFIPFLGRSQGTNILCSGCLRTPLIRYALGHAP